MRIAEYEAPKEKLLPENEGWQAWETAGRRIGPLYNQEAQDIKEEGRLKAQEIEDLAKWPFDILELRDREAEIMNKAPQGAGFRVVGEKPQRNPYQPLQEISNGAPTMASAARSLIAPNSGSPSTEVYDPNAIQGGPTYTLQGGNLVKVNPSNPNAEFQKQNQQLDQDVASSASQWFQGDTSSFTGGNAGSAVGNNYATPTPTISDPSPTGVWQTPETSVGTSYPETQSSGYDQTVDDVTSNSAPSSGFSGGP